MKYFLRTVVLTFYSYDLSEKKYINWLICMLNKSIAIQNYCLSFLLIQRKWTNNTGLKFDFFSEYWPWHTITFCGMQKSQHIWANTHKCIIISHINQTYLKLTTPGNLFQVLKISPIFNSDLQQIHNSQFHSFQTVQLHIKVSSSCSHHNSFHGTSWLGVRKTCRFTVIPPMREPPINWPTVNLVYITQKCRDKLIPFLKQKT